MKRVFLIERPKGNIDLSTAEHFGELRVLFPPGEHRVSVFATSEFSREVVARLKSEGFDNLTDSVCVAGSMIAMVTAVAAIIVEYGFVNVLFFNSTIEAYARKTIGSEKHD